MGELGRMCAYRSARPARGVCPASSRPCWTRPARSPAAWPSSSPKGSGPDTTRTQSPPTLQGGTENTVTNTHSYSHKPVHTHPHIANVRVSFSAHSLPVYTTADSLLSHCSTRKPPFPTAWECWHSSPDNRSENSGRDFLITSLI